MERGGPLYIIPWRCTFTCDSGCVHCASADKPPMTDEMSTANALRMIDQVYAFGTQWLGISGGEPFLREDLFEIVGYARKIGLNVSIITGGRHFNDEKFEAVVKNEVRV
ncbi:MAG: radical SAM protein, partial [Candidatus Bathyarchaeia archaeon]